MAQQSEAIQKFNSLRDALSGNVFMQRIGQVLPKHITAERMIRIALHATNRNPLLLQCTHESIMGSLMDASQLGLEPSSVLGTAHLVPYRNGKTGKYEAQLITGFKGLIDLARRSGQVLSVESRVVYVGDEFEYAYGTDSYIKHKPSMVGGYDVDVASGEPRDRPIVAFYAVAHIRESRPQFEIMSLAEVEAIRRQSKARANGPWVEFFSEMGRKTVVRRLSKYLPQSPELARALEIEDRAEGFGEYIDVPFENIDPNGQTGEGEEEGQKPDKLKEQLRARQGKSTGEPASTATEPQPESQENLGV